VVYIASRIGTSIASARGPKFRSEKLLMINAVITTEENNVSITSIHKGGAGRTTYRTCLQQQQSTISTLLQQLIYIALVMNDTSS
jgi:microcompartment protein CcmK/EutM